MRPMYPYERRIFLRRFITLIVGIFVLAVAFVFGKFSVPSKKEQRTYQKVRVCDEDKVPILGVRNFEISYLQQHRRMTQRVFLIGLGMDAPPKALSAICTHLGCQVEWKRDQNAFVCPCHEGTYAMVGTVLSGPPPAPLRELPLTVSPHGAFVDIQAG